MIAEVIVDVSAYAVDRPFDYFIPVELQGIIEPGMRVKVPFGPRSVMGFVMKTKAETELEQVKPIDELLDYEPVFTSELLELSTAMKELTLCHEIDALKVMLPAAMRAKYVKRAIRLVGEEELSSTTLKEWFNGKEEKQVAQNETAELLKILKEAIVSKQVAIETNVKQKTSVKTVRVVYLKRSNQELLEDIDQTPKQAKKQVKFLQWAQQQKDFGWPIQQCLDQSEVSIAVLHALEKRNIISIKNEEIYRDPTAHIERNPENRVLLTDEQETAISQVISANENKKAETFLLHGITGSGKTEVYLNVIEHVLEKGENAVMLVPEISLTPQLTNRFIQRFGSKVAVLHSALSTGEKYDEWRRIHRGEVQVAIGARSAIFAPFENLGVIILDEEHEATYKQDDVPRYHARDIAICRSQYYNCPVILGSATPSLESYARAQKDVYQLLELSKRPLSQPLPTVEIVDMREQLKSGNRSMFSMPLAEAIRDRLEKKEQIVLFLNRRGYSSFVMCRDCGIVMQCPNCDISYTYHRSQEILRCHYCGAEEQVPHTCPACESEHIRFFGTGTQKVEEELFKLFPEARVLRMDVDTTRTKGAHEQLLNQFGNGEADILLGTQMIAKGLDFPNITLVGVLTADTMLHLPDFRAAEKTFQLLTQVSGRAGRHEKEGEVLIQTYTPEHYAIQLSKTQDYKKFYQFEMIERKMKQYPPFTFITLIQFSHEDVMKTAEFAHQATTWLKNELHATTEIIGPTVAPISRIQNRYRYQCLLKYKKEPRLIEALQKLYHIYRTEWMKKGLVLSIDLHPSSIL